MNHILISVILQIILGFAFGNWWLGAFIGTAFFAGREIAQAEYRWIETYGNGKRANMPMFGGFDRKVWSGKSLRDVFFPLIVCFAVALFALYITKHPFSYT